MNIQDAAKVLAKVQAYDNRRVGELNVAAWAEALSDRLTLAGALTAVGMHFAATSDWCMPSHINELGRAIRNNRSVQSDRLALEASWSGPPDPITTARLNEICAEHGWPKGIK